MKANLFSHTLLVWMQNGIATLQNISSVSYKVKFTSYEPGIPLLSIYPRKIKTYFHTKTCI